MNPLHDMPVGTPCGFSYTTGLTKSDASILYIFSDKKATFNTFKAFYIFRSSYQLTCKLVSCCCWWAMVCFTKTLLMLCSIAYFLA